MWQVEGIRGNPKINLWSATGYNRYLDIFKYFLKHPIGVYYEWIVPTKPCWITCILCRKIEQSSQIRNNIEFIITSCPSHPKKITRAISRLHNPIPIKKLTFESWNNRMKSRITIYTICIYSCTLNWIISKNIPYSPIPLFQCCVRINCNKGHSTFIKSMYEWHFMDQEFSKSIILFLLKYEVICEKNRDQIKKIRALSGNHNLPLITCDLYNMQCKVTKLYIIVVSKLFTWFFQYKYYLFFCCNVIITIYIL